MAPGGEAHVGRLPHLQFPNAREQGAETTMMRAVQHCAAMRSNVCHNVRQYPSPKYCSGFHKERKESRKCRLCKRGAG